MASPRALRQRAAVVRERLAAQYPGGARELCALRHRNPFELLVATILSAQCTDERVNMVTPQLFAAAPDPVHLAGIDRDKLEDLIRSTGFFRAKSQNLQAMARTVVERFDGEVPDAMEDLVTLPGVGRKTANVVRSVAFDEPGLPVDTHVGRISRRLGLTANDDPVKVEQDLDGVVPPGERGVFSLRLILHGRAVCTARSPKCPVCVLADVCPSAGIGSPVAPKKPGKPRGAAPATPPGSSVAKPPAKASAKPRAKAPAKPRATPPAKSTGAGKAPATPRAKAPAKPPGARKAAARTPSPAKRRGSAAPAARGSRRTPEG